VKLKADCGSRIQLYALYDCIKYRWLGRSAFG